jgi:bifunctional DNase/RNase
VKHVELAGLAVEETTGAPLLVLRERDAPHRLLPIFIGSAEAAAIAIAASGHAPPRPLTHDLMATLVRSLEGHIDAAEITGLSDGSYLASLAVSGPAGEQRLDTRPSDAIALALRMGAPLFASEAVLDEAGTLPSVEVDEEAIDEAVEEFRSFLDDVDPSQFIGDADSTLAEPSTADTDDHTTDIDTDDSATDVDGSGDVNDRGV